MSELHLRVYANRSELVQPNGKSEVFLEGATSVEAKERYAHIVKSLQNSFLRQQIELCRDKPHECELSVLTALQRRLLDAIVGAMTSEAGRALIGLTILQLTIKAICPEQSVRLHKGGSSAKDFSWRDGVSMRSLDNRYITPALREYGLLKLNRDGFMMTRSLAENYPYSKVYKAYIKGARAEWAMIVEAIDANEIHAKAALQYVISQLLNGAEEFKNLARQTLEVLLLKQNAGGFNDRSVVLRLLSEHIRVSDYAARIMEIGMHALIQAMQEASVLGNATVKPLSQMRSANKKHGNIGDVEILESGQIVEAWDAKYGKPYLRDELEELNDKLVEHPNINVAGFVTSEAPERQEELETRLFDIEQSHGIKIQIMRLDDWVDALFERSLDAGASEEELATLWVTAYTESLAQHRPDIAPIDEPCYQWLNSLKSLLETNTGDKITP
ncbi:MAG: hypothetical protein NT023_25145 [Armatimonadetes bacterium]|nr:hypothetical protein [Armatimonadota bacterium]